MSSRHRVVTTIAGMVLVIGLTGCGGDDKAEQTDTGTTTGSTTTGTTTGDTPASGAPAAPMDPNMPGMDHPAGKM